MSGRGRTALVVLAERDPGMAATLAAAAVRGLENGGWNPQLIDLYADGFRVAMSRAERLDYETEQPISDPLVQRYATAVTNCSCLVFVYSVADAVPPSILKGFLERVFVAGVAFPLPSSGASILGGLNHIDHFVGVCTYELSRVAMAMRGDQGRRLVTRCLRLMSTRLGRRTRWLALYGSKHHDSRAAGSFIHSVERCLESL